MKGESKMYKGYYIDGIRFTSKEDIDSFLKNKAIEAFKTACKLFNRDFSLEASNYCGKLAEQLHNNFNLSWNEIEAIEISTF